MAVATVYRCVSVLSDSVAGLPLHYMLHKGGRYAIADNSPMEYMLSVEPTPMMSSYTMWSMAVKDMLLWGNAYIYPRKVDGEITDLREILKIISCIMDRCGSRTIIAKCRETTSCRLLRLLADRGRIEILEDQVTYSLGEEFHFLKFRVSRDYLERQKENRRKRGRANEKSTGHHPDHGPGRRCRPGRHLGIPLYEP